MTLEEFDTGYWYALALKRFAKRLGIASSSRMRKDELETAIRSYLVTGKYAPVETRRIPAGVPKDGERGLRLDLPIRRYTNDARTKTFVETQSRKLSPAHKQRSGARYRLNRWREQRTAAGKTITYGDLVREYVRLCRPAVKFERVAHGTYYVYFMADFLRGEPDASRAAAIRAWHQLKRLDVAKSYAAWKKATQA
jgi:hypothetical protein